MQVRDGKRKEARRYRSWITPRTVITWKSRYRPGNLIFTKDGEGREAKVLLLRREEH